MNAMTSAFRLYSKELLPLYLFVCILLIMGVVFGALLVNALTLQQKQDVGQFISAFVSNYSSGVNASAAPAASNPPTAAEVWEVFGSHVRWVFIVWILGLSVAGVPLILLLDFLKGVLIGFTVGYLAGQWSWKGVVFALVSVVPQNMIAVPALVVASVGGISFSLLLIRSKLIHGRGTLGRPFMSFTLSTLGLAALLLLVSLFEVYISPGLLARTAPMLLDHV